MRKCFCILAFPFLLAACGAPDREANLPSVFETQPATGGSVVLDGVTVIDTYTGSLTENRAVVVTGGVIREIKPSGSALPEGVQRVDAHAKFLVPGYFDMHNHVLNDRDPDRGLTLMLAKGIVGFRQMSGSDKILELHSTGHLKDSYPQLLVSAGQVIFTPGSEAEIQEEVAKQKKQGADFIKIVVPELNSFYGYIKASRQQGMQVAGHAPPAADVFRMAREGFYSDEHLGPSDTLLLNCSTEEASIREGLAKAKVSGPPTPPKWLMAVLKPVVGGVIEKKFLRFVNSPYEGPFTTDEVIARFRRVVDTFDEGKCNAFVKRLAEVSMWHVPTLIRMRTMTHVDDPEFRRPEYMKYIDQERKDMWFDLEREFEQKPESFRRTLADLYSLQMKLMRMLARADVKLAAGSDYGGIWEVPGISLHQEFDLLKAAGVPPLQVLQMTTLDGAKFLKREETMGSVGVGKVADLVLLDRNPLQDSENLHSLYAVVRDGHFMGPDALTAMLKHAEYQ